MKFNSLESIFASFQNLRVLIIGDVMIDSYMWGKVERISPEAPVPILNIQKKEQRLGGAANVALNISALGATPILCSVIGNDLDADIFLQLLEESKLSSECIFKVGNRTTTIKHRFMSGAHHLLRVDQEIDSEIDLENSQKLIDCIKRQIPNCDVVVFEDYDKGVITPNLIQEVITFANSQGKPTVVDPKKRNFLSYKNATLFKPNKKELKEGLKLDGSLSKIEEIERAVLKLQDEIQAQSILITLSENGIYLHNKNNGYHLPAHMREIADVSGAGDTVISVAAICQALALPNRLIAALSNLAGGLVCEHAGVVPIDKDTLLQESQNLGFAEYLNN
ncbi:MAG TPA: bifunctional ADP-heptose synthase [Cytophagaceae bacterium]